MKKINLMVAMSLLAVPIVAQQTNQLERKLDGYNRKAAHETRQRERTKAEEERRQQRLDFMAKVMDEVGVSAKEKESLQKLQEGHKARMRKINAEKIELNQKLEDLLSVDATDAEIEAVIIAITNAQGVQLRMLVQHRREMEKIIGKKKCKEMMDKALEQLGDRNERPGRAMLGGRFGKSKPSRDEGTDPKDKE